jgi:hypothetical protein
MDFSYIKLPKGIETREPTKSELEFFKSKPYVPAYAADDNKVVLNPFAPRKKAEFQATALNEAARILIRTKPQYQPKFELTDQQKSMLDSNNSYRNASDSDRKATIAARIMTGDKSAGIATSEQILASEELKRALGIRDLNIDWQGLQ